MPNDLTIEYLPLAGITPYWRNPRHSDRAVAAVRASIEAYGFNVPLVLDAQGTIIAGHTRYRAATALGLERVPCVVRADLTPEQVRQYRIADNKTSELAPWDMDKLLPELREIGDLADMRIYFPDDDLDRLLADTAGTGSFGAPTQEDVDASGERMRNRFENSSREARAGLIDLTCPECGADFAVDRKDVMKRTALGPDFEGLEAILHKDQRHVLDMATVKVRAVLADLGVTPHENAGIWLGQVIEALAAEYLAGPDTPARAAT
jgi:hypothetical protein